MEFSFAYEKLGVKLIAFKIAIAVYPRSTFEKSYAANNRFGIKEAIKYMDNETAAPIITNAFADKNIRVLEIFAKKRFMLPSVSFELIQTINFSLEKQIAEMFIALCPAECLSYVFNIAIREDCIDIICKLFKKPGLKVEPGAVLCLAAVKGRFEIFKLIHEKGHDIHVLDDLPLAYASGYPEIVEYIRNH